MENIASAELPTINNRTLVNVRWMAIAGQTFTLLVTQIDLGIKLPLAEAFAWVALSAIVNLATAFMPRMPRLLTPLQATLYLAFDLIQLTALICLTGGIQNPFSILLLASVTVGASLLPIRYTVLLMALSGLCASLIAAVHIRPSWADWPVFPPTYVIGQWIALIFSSGFIAVYVWKSVSESRRVAEAYHATQMALSRQQKMAALGAQAAAAAHELGSPLNTVALIASELQKDIPPGSPYAEDVALLVSQSRRCSDILKTFSKGPKEDNPDLMDPLPPAALLEVISQPFLFENNKINIFIDVKNKENVPLIRKTSELSHGLGNLIQNAIQHAQSTVSLHSDWRDDYILIVVQDDGNGFSNSVLGKIGEPFISTKKHGAKNMGLGIFIAQTLLETTGARLTFENAEGGGAKISVRWVRKDIESADESP